ncbi:hypothetical protein [Nonomuraea cavernae]|uniref:Uncharacterized protein n=1 Tax=Nonomuraea cavernae TaxID=2045107 RepID=A0A917YYQ5_9ACTN|nr:hypothetical protein [Nonomuraea cavernae]MCA2186162.1 hypothetical protein [Nonomuraea cavernae]GGO70023.1 hypothetical protein GCM10012289_32500 [Nonomuraea cavernae]
MVRTWTGGCSPVRRRAASARSGIWSRTQSVCVRPASASCAACSARLTVGSVANWPHRRWLAMPRRWALARSLALLIGVHRWMR